MENKKKSYLYLLFIVLSIVSIVLIIKFTQVESPRVNLIFPKDNSILNSRNVELKWDIQYKRELSLISELFLGTNELEKVYDGIETKYPISLKPGTYFWKVGIKFGNDYIETPVSSFTILNDIPKILDARATVNGNRVTFSWDAEDNDKLNYTLYLNNREIKLKDNKYEIVLPTGKYKWSVQCEDEFGAKAVSNTFEFYINPVSIDFEIIKEEGKYKVKYNKYDDFEYYLEINNEEIKLGSSEYILSVKPNVKYKLRLKAVNLAGEYVYSSYKEIYVKNQKPKIRIIFPKNGLKGVGKSITFRWNIEDDDETLSTLYFGISKDKLKPVVRNYRANVYEIKDLSSNSKYFWKLKVTDGYNTIETPVFEFYTNPAVKILGVIGSKEDDHVYNYTYIDGSYYILGKEGKRPFILKDGVKFYFDLDGELVDLKKKDGILYVLANGAQDIILYALKDDVILWKKVYGGRYKDRGREVIVENDGLLIFGDTWSDDFVDLSGWSDVFLIKVDFDGNIIWKRNFGGKYLDEAVSISKGDGGYVIFGNTFRKSRDLMVVFVDYFGRLRWIRFFGGKEDDFASKALVYKDKIYLVSNVYFDSKGNITDDSNIYIMILDSNGNRLNDYILEGSKDDVCNDMLVGDDGIYLFGKTASKDGDFYSLNYKKGLVDFFVIRLNHWIFVGGGYGFDEIKRALNVSGRIKFVGETNSLNGLFDRHLGGLDIFVGELER
ncbi:hypothetical protein XJ44_01795 [Thermosipho affectus]|uniref:Fibronectin type III domain protein n=1 Tax=Thermosipho affectus TaxID=660294 RepID=A0ABX3IKM8_9BACT|nr:hypothetical protein [Thermosipho affectus]ONN27729.1 hypothetical protein XJ44_01795 [Thermosipho affectus]